MNKYNLSENMIDIINSYPQMHSNCQIIKENGLSYSLFTPPDTFYSINSIEALILSLCYGRYSTAEIFMSIANLANSEDIYVSIVSIIERYKDFIVFNKDRDLLKKQKFLVTLDDAIINAKDEELTLPPYPLAIHFILLKSCNLKCKYCFNAGLDWRGRLSPKDVHRVLRESAENGLVVATFSGGEPTLDPNLVNYIKSCIDYNISPWFSSNALNLTSTLVNELVDAGLKEMQISLDTINHEIFAKLTGSNKLNTILSNILYAIKSGINVTINIVACSANESSVIDVAKWSEDAGAHKVVISPNDKVMSNIIADKRSTLRSNATDKLQQMIKSAKLTRTSISKSQQHWHSPSNITSCGGLFRSLHILPNGDITICSMMTSHSRELNSYGNIKKDTITSAWRSKKFYEIRKKLLTKDKESNCAECAHYNGCYTGCFAAKTWEGIKLTHPDPKCRLYQQDNK